MLFERWMSSVLLYFGNMFFYFIMMFGVVSVYKCYKNIGIVSGWVCIVFDML